ncbi:hypothetical protein GCM10011514_00580 [Emticicia aquatilis]|uniref:Secretion system C-terminal sorting domain-containing protein n=1 Tax=Emticicia aquatilis TaxID=1537369 RepID=A0A916YD16_9BACT|nr:hypothetical protein GCM10011514_00580 [Emticicia aquatilis]
MFAQTDFTKISWRFRGPVNYNLGSKEVIDIATDPNDAQKLWACTLEDGLLFNDNVVDANSQWQRSSLVNRRVYKMKFHPNKPLVAFAIGDFVNWKTTDGGKTWSEIINNEASTRFYDIWVSKEGKVIAATKNDVFTSLDEGKTWKKVLRVENSRIIKQLWVQENERIYVLMEDNNGLYSDGNNVLWNNISLDQMRKEEMPYPELEEFHAYVVQSGEVFHGFTVDRKKIKLLTKYSIDGGLTYQPLLSPTDINETVFVGNDIVFATKKGIVIYKESRLQERNLGQLQGEYRMFAKKPFAGDNNIVALSTKGMFLMNSIERGDAYEVINQGEYYNNIVVDAKNTFAAVEADKINFIGFNHLEGRKIIALPNNINLFLTNNGQLGRWIGNNTGNLSLGKLSIIETTTTPIVDIYYNSTINTVFCLLRDGRFLTILNPDAENTAFIVKKIFQFQLPIKTFNEIQIEELTSDGSQVLICDKTKYLFAIMNNGVDKIIKQINTDAIKDLKINYLEYSLVFQKLFLATEKGVFMGENILSDTPKWTNISNEIGEQACVFVKIRSLDGQLSVMTRYSGIYTTTLFAEKNTIVTHSPKFFNTYPSPNYYWSSTLTPFYCNQSKIKIDFTTNIPSTEKVKYVVEVSDINGNFPTVPFILKGEASESPVEVEFVKPQDQRANFFRFRVLAQGAVSVVGSATPLIGINDDKDFIHETIKKTLVCDKESIELMPAKDIDYGPYSWKKENNTVATTATYTTNQSGVYKRTVVINGCNVSSVFEVSKALNTRPFFKPNVGFSYAGNTCVVDSFKLFTDYDNSYKYVWYRDDLILTNLNKSEIFVKDKSQYKVLVTSQDGCSAISEIIQLKTCDNGTDNRAIILNSPTISVDKKSIYPNDKATIQLESCDNVSMQWLKDSKPLLGANQSSLEVKEAGNYALQISKFGCTTMSKTVAISVETILAVGEERHDFDIEVFPNPTEEKIFISIPTLINTPIDVKLTDISGKLIGKYDVSSNSQFIDLKSLQEGTYLLVFEVKDKRVVKKIIKNN